MCSVPHYNMLYKLEIVYITGTNPGRAACPCTNELYQINKALTKFNEALTKPYHGLMEILP